MPIDFVPATRITTHAIERAELRLNLSPSAFARLIIKVRERGRRHDSFTGTFRHYLDSMFFKYRIREIFVYGEYVYPFTHDNAIPTVIRVPNRLKRYLHKDHKRFRPPRHFD